jgi:sugar/nucleoside kinase (ribokinase family)
MRHGPSAMVVKLGKYGAALVTPDESFWIPAFPVDFVADPTGAGDTFAGGFVGCIAAHDGEVTSDVLRLAMAYGTALASFNVEEFGTERVARLTAEEIVERVEELQRMTTFDAKTLALR